MTRPLGKTVWKLLAQAERESGILPVERTRKGDEGRHLGQTARGNANIRKE